MTKEIQLTQGQTALVDDDDFDTLNQFKWIAQRSRSTFYANQCLKVNGKWTAISMHRAILSPLPDEETDHINGNGLDNRRSNLRLANRAQNSFNRKLNKNNKSGFKGVRRSPSGRWRAEVRFKGKTLHLGHFNTVERAAQAYDSIAIELFGEFARLNFQEDHVNSIRGIK